jgi:predicted nucleotidyltransferase component of viral defense system
VIARAHITAWAAVAPWPFEYQIEQDLLLSRLMIEIAQHRLLGSELRMRGGTCLHKLVLPAAQRYSEDLDYVRSTRSGVGPIIDALRELAEHVGLDIVARERARGMVHVILETESTVSATRLRVKVEINVEETTPLIDPIQIEHSVDSAWWSGSAPVTTFALEELMGTKLRALYQRSKGRDIFDLWYVLTTQDVDDELIVDALHHYMADDAFTYPQLRQNLRAKIADPDFRTDMQGLLVDAPADWDVTTAADIVMQRLGRHLRNAPTPSEIAEGSWRT